MDGANWIDVEAQSYPPQCNGWVIVYPRGQCITPDTPSWRDLRHRVEEIATAVMVALGAPFLLPISTMRRTVGLTRLDAGQQLRLPCQAAAAVVAQAAEDVPQAPVPPSGKRGSR